VTDPAPLRLAFMGSPDFSVPTLNALISAGHDVVCVYAQPPRPAGRGQKERPCPVHAAALDAGIEVRTPKSLKTAEAQHDFAALHLDAAIVVAYGLILPAPILEAPKLGCLNVHASLLPRWRGAAPIQRAIEAGDTETGVCIMQMDVGLDTGPVLARSAIQIAADETAGELHDRLSVLGAALLGPILAAFATGEVTPTPQSEDGVTYAHKISKDEGALNFNAPADTLVRKVRALTPWPGAWFQTGDQRIKVGAVEVAPGDSSKAPGTVLDDTLRINCAEGALRPTLLQRPGRGMMETDAFLRGHPMPVGTILGERG
jgi:methionyl-tRNA formyltransferase